MNNWEIHFSRLQKGDGPRYVIFQLHPYQLCQIIFLSEILVIKCHLQPQAYFFLVPVNKGLRRLFVICRLKHNSCEDQYFAMPYFP